MKSFVGVATLILGVAAGVMGYEALTGSAVQLRDGPPEASLPPHDGMVGMVGKGGKALKPVSRTKTPRIATPRTVDPVTPRPPQPPALERVIAAQGGSDFPILIPARATRDAAAVADHNLRLKLLDDGYSAVITTDAFDIVIYGTRIVFRRKAAFEAELEEVKAEREAERQQTGTIARPDTSRDPGTSRTSDEIEPRVRPPYTMRFEESGDGDGGSISFGRFGVDYHIEFYCRDIESLSTGNCIDEAGARAIIMEMEEGADGGS